MRVLVLLGLVHIVSCMPSHSERLHAKVSATDCRDNIVVHTKLETNIALKVLNSQHAPEIIIKYLNGLGKEGAFTHPSNSDADFVFRWAWDFYVNIRRAYEHAYPGSREEVQSIRWLYTFLQTDWRVIISSAQLGIVEDQLPPPSGDAQTEKELQALLPYVDLLKLAETRHTYDRLLYHILAGKAYSFNEIRSSYANGLKRTSNCQPPWKKRPVRCSDREQWMQGDYWMFTKYRGRQDRDPESVAKIMLERRHSVESSHAGIASTENIPYEAQEFFTVQVVHEGKVKFMPSTVVVGAQTVMKQKGAPFIAGPSGTMKQYALTLERTDEVHRWLSPTELAAASTTEKLDNDHELASRLDNKYAHEEILAVTAMVVLAGGHHSLVELLLGMQTMGYFLDIPSFFETTREYSPLDGAFVHPSDGIHSICTPVHYDEIVDKFSKRMDDMQLTVENWSLDDGYEAGSDRSDGEDESTVARRQRLRDRKASKSRLRKVSYSTSDVAMTKENAQLNGGVRSAVRAAVAKSRMQKISYPETDSIKPRRSQSAKSLMGHRSKSAEDVED